MFVEVWRWERSTSSVSMGLISGVCCFRKFPGISRLGYKDLFLCGGYVQCLREVFSKGVGFSCWEWESIRFWFDDWVGVGPFHVLSPRVLSIKESSILDSSMAGDPNVPWDVSYRRVLHQSKEVQYGEWLSLLSNVVLCRNDRDVIIWKLSPSGCFSVKAFYLAREYSYSKGSLCSRVVGLGSSTEAFCWLVIVGRCKILWGEASHLKLFQTFVFCAKRKPNLLVISSFIVR